MSEKDNLFTILDALDPQQRSALLEAARNIALPKPSKPGGETIALVPPPPSFWHFVSGMFECYVPFIDAPSANDAIKLARSGDHPWYANEKALETFPIDVVESVNRDKWVEWLRRR